MTWHLAPQFRASCFKLGFIMCIMIRFRDCSVQVLVQEVQITGP